MNNQNGQNFNSLDQAILKTLAFFDIFDYPLTLVELYKWLYQPDRSYKLLDIIKVLESNNLNQKISSLNGFYFLTGRQEIVRIRLDRYLIAEHKFAIALRFARWLRWLSFVKMIAVCNNLGYNNATKNSDIDYFIVVDRGRVWLARLAVTLIATVLKIRRHGTKVVDRICLSFYIGQDHLNLSDIALKPTDPYLVYWFATLGPIFDNGVYQEFFGQNSWLKNYLPNFYQTQLSDRRSVVVGGYIKFSRAIDQVVLQTFIGNWLEKISRLIQIKKLKKYLGESLGKSNTNVVISSSILKFHKIDRRQTYSQAWQQKLTSL